MESGVGTVMRRQTCIHRQSMAIAGSRHQGSANPPVWMGEDGKGKDGTLGGVHTYYVL